jgi:hypothetical protein
MFIYNYILVRSQLFVLSPIFPFLLSLVLFISLRSFDSPFLCEGETIEELKNNLNEEIINYNNAYNKYKFWADCYSVAIKSPEPKLESYCLMSDKSIDGIKEAAEIFKKIRRIERIIQKEEPSFKSGLEIQWFERDI